MKLNKVGTLFLLTMFVGSSVAIEMNEKKEENSLVALDASNGYEIIPTKYKNLPLSQNCFKRLMEKIEHSKSYKFLDKYMAKKANKLITENAKGLMVMGVAGMQMIISRFSSISVFYTANQEMGNCISQYGIQKKNKS